MSTTIGQLQLPSTNGHCPECAGIGTLQATDIFCGAGGSSLGLEFVVCPACGRSLIEVTQALNHWDLAVQAHNANFPNADHDVHDVEVIPTTRFRRTDMLWASPECTHHAYCRGPKATTEDAIRSRATFADIIRFTGHHQYDAVIVENVIEARLWCDEPGHKEKCSCGGTFTAWYKRMLALGYEGRILYFNSQFAMPTPQSRDRMYVVFWRVGARTPELDFMPPSWCSHCETVVQGIQTWKKPSKGSTRAQPGMSEWGRYGQQYVYACPRCANRVAPAVVGSATIIDRAFPMTVIGDRAKPLADKTRERIRVGMQKILSTPPEHVPAGGGIYRRAGGTPVWSLTHSHGAIVQVAGNLGRMNGGKVSRPVEQSHAHSTDVPIKAVHGSSDRGIVIPNMAHNTGRSTEEPIGSVTTGNRHILVQPEVIVQLNRGGKTRDSHLGRSRALGEPTQTITGAHRGELAIVSMRNHGDVHSVDEPAQTVCGGGYHHGLLVYNGVPGFVRSLSDAAGTLTGRDKQSLLVPYYRTGVARTLAEPTGAVTGHDREALVEVSDADIDSCGFRMLKWPELLRAQMMQRLPDGSDYILAARSRDKRGKVRELSNEDRIKMIGNAVSSPVATMLGWAVVDSLR